MSNVEAQSSGGTGATPIQVNVSAGGEIGKLTVPLQVLILFTVLSIAPGILIMMTCFVRIVIVLSFLKSALNIQQPPTQVLLAMALFLTFFIMSPTFNRVNEEALKPYQEGKLSTEEVFHAAVGPVKEFMLLYVRETELAFFMDAAPEPVEAESAEEVPVHIIIPAFMLSELKTGFQMGLLIILPFLVIDMVIASILMSLGMFMLPPPIVALPIKLMIFVLVDGWTLLLNAVIMSFQVAV